MLLQDTESSCDHIAFEVPDVSHLEEAQTLLMREGFDILSTYLQEEGIAHALRFVGPGGFVFELFTGMDYSQPVRYALSGVRPRKFGHVTLKVVDVAGMEDFLTRLLGFHVSDRVGSDAVFLRCNTDHHGINLLKTSVNQLHHYAFELEHWAAYEQLGDHFRLQGQTFLWGPGRHGPGDNLFCYVLDPVGSIVEFYADMQQIESETAYHPQVWGNVPLTANQWGPLPPEHFFALGLGLAQGRTEPP